MSKKSDAAKRAIDAATASYDLEKAGETEAAKTLAAIARAEAERVNSLPDDES